MQSPRTEVSWQCGERQENGLCRQGGEKVIPKKEKAGCCCHLKEKTAGKSRKEGELGREAENTPGRQSEP